MYQPKFSYLQLVLLVIPSWLTASHEIDSINANAFSLKDVEPSKALELAETALDKSNTADYPLGMVEAYFTIGYASDDLGKPAESISALMSGIKTGKGSSDPSVQRKVASIYQIAGYVLNNYGMYGEALEFFDDRIETALKLGDTLGMAVGHHFKSRIYRKTKNFELALKEVNLALAKARAANHQRMILVSLNTKGLAFYEAERYQEAKEIFLFMLQRIDVVGRSEYGYFRGIALDNLAMTHFKLQEFDQAEDLLSQSLASHGQTESEWLFSALINNAEVFAAQEKFEEAYKYGLKAYTMYDHVQAKPEYFKLFNIMTQAAHAIGKVDEALTYSMKYHQVNEEFRAHQDEIMQISQQVEVALIQAGFYRDLSSPQSETSDWLLMGLTFIFSGLLVGGYLRRQVIKFRVEREMTRIINRF